MRRACLRKPYWVLCIQGIGWLLSRRREFLRIFSLFIPLSWFLFFVFYPLTSSRASFFLRPYFARALDWVLYYFSNPCFPIAGGIAYEQCYHHPQLFFARSYVHFILQRSFSFLPFPVSTIRALFRLVANICHYTTFFHLEMPPASHSCRT